MINGGATDIGRTRTTTGERLRGHVGTAGRLLSDVRSVWAFIVATLVLVGGVWSWAQTKAEKLVATVADEALGKPDAEPGKPGGAPLGSNAAAWYTWAMGLDAKATAAIEGVRWLRDDLGSVQEDVRALVEGQGRDLCIQAAGIPGPGTSTPTDPDPGGVCRFYDEDFRPIGSTPLKDHAELTARVTARLEAAARKKAGRRR